MCLQSTGRIPLHSTKLIDEILQQGTDLYFSLITRKKANISVADQCSSSDSTPTISIMSSMAEHQYLLIDQLPETAVLSGSKYSVEKLSSIYTGYIGTDESRIPSLEFSLSDAGLSDAVNGAFGLSKSCFLTLGAPNYAYTSAVTQSGDIFLCFDSHSRASDGTCVVDGKSVLLEINSSAGVVIYIRDLAKSLFHNTEKIQFEFVPVICSVQEEPEAETPRARLECDNYSSSTNMTELSQSETVNQQSNKPSASSGRSRPAQFEDFSMESIPSELVPTVCSRDQFYDWCKPRLWLFAKHIIINVTCNVTVFGTLFFSNSVKCSNNSNYLHVFHVLGHILHLGCVIYSIPVTGLVDPPHCFLSDHPRQGCLLSPPLVFFSLSPPLR